MGDLRFDGLDCRLNVSRMVVDLFMMDILSTAMDEAYGRICSSNGDLRRLNDRSRFCELAIVQLEWCLRFMQEEMDMYVFESGREREKLVRDLEDTRDRMQMRMEEIEEAIKKKDVELMERGEKELELRAALELKDGELRRLHGGDGDAEEEEMIVEVEEELEEEDGEFDDFSSETETEVEIHDRIVIVETIRDIKNTTCRQNPRSILLQSSKPEGRKEPLQVAQMDIHKFSQSVLDFEDDVSNKLRTNMLRLKELENQVDPLINQVESLRNKKLLYENAFYRRCCDLLLAEKEVDFLGDEVDELVSILEKIYIGLKKYSPLFRHQPEMVDILRLIWKKLQKKYSGSTSCGVNV